jgi:hypothetical protein
LLWASALPIGTPTARAKAATPAVAAAKRTDRRSVISPPPLKVGTCRTRPSCEQYPLHRCSFQGGFILEPLRRDTPGREGVTTGVDAPVLDARSSKRRPPVAKVERLQLEVVTSMVGREHEHAAEALRSGLERLAAKMASTTRSCASYCGPRSSADGQPAQKADASVVSSGANPDVTPVAHRHAI